MVLKSEASYGSEERQVMVLKREASYGSEE